MAFMYDPGCPCCQPPCDKGICVKVYDKKTGAPMAGADVEIGYTAIPSGWEGYKGTTDSNGIFCDPSGDARTLIKIIASKKRTVNVGAYPLPNGSSTVDAECGCVYGVKYFLDQPFYFCTCGDSPGTLFGFGVSTTGSKCALIDPTGGKPIACKPMTVEFEFCEASQICVKGVSTYDGREVKVMAAGTQVPGFPLAPLLRKEGVVSSCYELCVPRPTGLLCAFVDNTDAPTYLGQKSGYGGTNFGVLGITGASYDCIELTTETSCKDEEYTFSFCDNVADCFQPLICSPDRSYNRRCLPADAGKPGCIGDCPGKGCGMCGTFNGTRWEYDEPSTLNLNIITPASMCAAEGCSTFQKAISGSPITLTGVPNPNYETDPFATKYSGYWSGWIAVNKWGCCDSRDVSNPNPCTPSPEPSKCCFSGLVKNGSEEWPVGCSCCNRGPGDCYCFRQCDTSGSYWDPVHDHAHSVVKYCKFSESDVRGHETFNKECQFVSWISIWAGLCGNGILVTALGHNYIEKVGCACPGGTETIRSEDCERLPDGTLNPACLCNCPSGSDCPDYNTSSHNKCKCANGVGGILVVPHTAVGPDGVEHIIVCHDGFGNATYCSENQPWSWGGPRMDHRGSLDFTNQFYGVVDDCSNCSVQLINQYIGGGSFEIKKTPLGTLQRC